MDIEDFFDTGKGPHSMGNMPPPKNQSFHQQVIEENNERQSKLKPLEGKLRNNVNMTRAMNGGSISMMNNNMNSGDIYPSNQMINIPAEITNPSYNEFDNNDAINYKLGPKAYALKRPGTNTYEHYENTFYPQSTINCIDVANHIKNCPICSKFYDNDKTMYVITIIVLIVICIILIRKVLENYEK